jgi:hypothetical protein
MDGMQMLETEIMFTVLFIYVLQPSVEQVPTAKSTIAFLSEHSHRYTDASNEVDPDHHLKRGRVAVIQL